MGKANGYGMTGAIQAFFAPAVGLMNRLGYTGKFALLWLMSLVAVVVVVFNLYAALEREIAVLHRELDGIALATPISRVVQLVQQHRGLSKAVVNGDKGLRERRAAKETEAADVFAATEGKLPPNLAASEDWRSIKANWQRLRSEGQNWTADENFIAHTRLIDQLLIFKIVVSGEYVLALDSQIDSAYLIDVAINRQPMALEHLGQIRAYGTDILSRKQIGESQQVVLKALVAQLADDLKFIKIDFEKVARYNPALQNTIASAFKVIHGSVQRTADLVESDILAGSFATSSEDFFLNTSAAIDDGYAQLYESLLPTLDAIIKARIARAENVVRVSVGVAFLLFLAVAYFSIGIYLATIGSIRALALSAHAFAGGDMGRRVRLDTRDELGLVGDSFNEMADGFCALLDARTRAEASSARESLKNQLLLRAASDGIHILDLDGNVVQASDAFCRMLGYTMPEVLGMNVAQWDAQWTAAQIRASIDAIGDQVTILETRHCRRDGSIIDVEVSAVRVEVDGRQLLFCSSRDVSARKTAEQALIDNRGRLQAVIETALDAVVQMDDAGIVTSWNPQAEKLFGWSREEAIGRRMSETIIPPQYREAHEQGLRRFLTGETGGILNSRIEMQGMHRSGYQFPVELSITAVRIAGRYEFNGFIRDITERKKAESLIWKQANFDTLTGLPNRHMFFDRLAQDIRKAGRAGQTMALLYIDLDRFKEVNDALGHSMGDKLLVEAARRIGACVRESDTVARMGGDEFIIILTELNEVRRVDALARNILRELAESFWLDNEVVYVSASIGITLYPHDASEMEALIKNADQAMYAAKNAGRNRFSYFTPSMQQAAQARLNLANALRGALAAGQFSIHYQPIVEFPGGRICKAEALIRWQHPVRGLIGPAEFIPLAEETGLISSIGDWVFREAARQAKRWRTLHEADFQISVNMSPVQFKDEGTLCQTWPAYLRELDLPGHGMVVEITEGLLLQEDPGVRDKLRLFREAGIRISLDDFGTGYSSLSYLQKFAIDYLKIDQSFTRGLESNSSSMALSEAIIVMSHRLGMTVIAEGVETVAQRELLAAAGCDFGQGYLFSRPVPAEEFEALLSAGN